MSESNANPAIPVDSTRLVGELNALQDMLRNVRLRAGMIELPEYPGGNVSVGTRDLMRMLTAISDAESAAYDLKRSLKIIKLHTPTVKVSHPDGKPGTARKENEL